MRRGLDGRVRRRALASVVGLEDALELVLLGVEKVDRARYERLALRWLARLLEERSPSLKELGRPSIASATCRRAMTRRRPGLRNYIRAGYRAPPGEGARDDRRDVVPWIRE